MGLLLSFLKMILNDAKKNKARLSITGSTGENGRVMTPEFPKAVHAVPYVSPGMGMNVSVTDLLWLIRTFWVPYTMVFLCVNCQSGERHPVILKTFPSAKNSSICGVHLECLEQTKQNKNKTHKDNFLHPFKMEFDWHAQLTWKYCILTEVVVQTTTHQFLKSPLSVLWFILTEAHLTSIASRCDMFYKKKNI